MSVHDIEDALRGKNLNKRVSPRAAGYMELEGATKDGNCNAVEVKGGVSGDLGCCNLFNPKPGAREFECETCKHFRSKEQS